ncbi:tyrosine-type recombinase/integrase [Thiorhodococcus minor]|uniref:Tyrosine-type recombinase/integrase n=2 Tax=Thiorhodococcus minor TaxID=57489 RepID=A0A6M0JS92_9GAMM|nr:tyrosine-type recombinase/integrase [Thiorhodococcus minor]
MSTSSSARARSIGMVPRATRCSGRVVGAVAMGFSRRLERVFAYPRRDANGDLLWSPVSKAGERAWRKALKRTGIEQFRWHDLRHTWASWHVQSGTPLHVLQELGGWSDFAMVRKYAHLAPEHLAEHAARIESGIRSVPHSFRHTTSADKKKAATHDA